MRTHDWLSSYRSAETIGYALDRMSLRLRHQPNALLGAVEELNGAYAQFEDDFLEFFPDAQNFQLRSFWRSIQIAFLLPSNDKRIYR